MIKIYITCPWQDATSILNKYKKNTPGNKGIWKNIQAIPTDHSVRAVIQN